MVRSVADWLCNVLVWGAIVTLAILLYEAFFERGFLAGVTTPIAAGAAIAAVAVLSVLWPRY